MKLFDNLKRLISKDELCGEWSSCDGSGFIIIMGSWMKIKSDGTAQYEIWGDESCENGAYNNKGEFKWHRMGDKKITIQEKGSNQKEEIKYELKKKNGRIELTSWQPELENFGVEGFWNFYQIMFKKK